MANEPYFGLDDDHKMKYKYTHDDGKAETHSPMYDRKERWEWENDLISDAYSTKYTWQKISSQCF